MTRFSRSPGNRACSRRLSAPNGEGGILSGLFSTVSNVLRLLTQCPCPSTTCDRWLVLERSGPFWAKSGPFSKVSAQFFRAMSGRVALSARASGLSHRSPPGWRSGRQSEFGSASRLSSDCDELACGDQDLVRHVLFHRRYQGWTGGHLVHAQYMRIISQLPGFEVAIYLLG